MGLNITQSGVRVAGVCPWGLLLLGLSVLEVQPASGRVPHVDLRLPSFLPISGLPKGGSSLLPCVAVVVRKG